jgi:hypothetical protein
MRRLSKQAKELARGRAPRRRDEVDLVRQQADLLAGEDRDLMMAYLQAGCKFHQLARLTGLNRSSVGRRIRRILRRLSDPTYCRCLYHDPAPSDLELDVIRDYFVRGLPLTRIAAAYGLCRYRARVIVDNARRIAQTQETSQPQSGFNREESLR